AKVLRYALGVIDVIERAAALAVRAVTVELRQTPLVPQLHRQADDGKAALLQDRGNGRAVHAAAHRDGRHRALIWIRVHVISIASNQAIAGFLYVGESWRSRSITGGIVSRAKSISSSVVWCPRLRRSVARASSGARPGAISTWHGPRAPARL